MSPSSSGIQSTDLLYEVVRQSRLRIRLAASRTTTVMPVRHVVSVRSDPEVFWVATCGRITRMKDGHAFWYLSTVPRFPGDPVYEMSPILDSHYAVAESIPRPLPDPATSNGRRRILLDPLSQTYHDTYVPSIGNTSINDAASVSR